MAFTCDSCGKVTSTAKHTTVLGRALCSPCNDRLSATSVALMSGGGTAEAVATEGWLKRIRAARRK